MYHVAADVVAKAGMEGRQLDANTVPVFRWESSRDDLVVLGGRRRLVLLLVLVAETA